MSSPSGFARFFDLAVPFFLPVWRRVATVIVPVLWALFEFANGAPFWALVFLALGGIAAFKFATADWNAVAARARADQEGR
ncbi:MAG: hypothetical protein ACSHW1_06515 [Yoonia sp.]|uniref:hypothetical protein n=1 Tax=Yoonia sp. TaxID=2212373 RepID=UPI003EFAF8CB